MTSISNPIKHLPIKNSSKFAAVRVVPITKRLLNIWRQQVQPLIDSNYSKHPSTANAHIRADVGWDWKKILNYALIHDVAFYSQENRTTLKLCVVAVPDASSFTEDDFFPIGLVTLVPSFKCNAGNVSDRAFTWYLSNAPREAYEKYLQGIRIEGVAKMLLDCVVQAAYDIGADGSMLLRAAPEGGAHLQQFYQGCGLRNLKPNNGPITFIRRKYPEQYFLLTRSSARDLTHAGDWLRK